MRIPFVDLKAQYFTIKKHIDEAISKVIIDTAFIKGKYVNDFETKFAEIYGVKNCISVANGTDAIYITLKMLEIGPGDEVITTAHSWISTSEAISQTGAKPVFIDIDNYFTIDSDLIENKITEKTKAIIPVHLYGQPADIEKINNIANRYNLFLIEDCAQAHFAKFKGKNVGTFGVASTFSFYPGKNLGAYGDAGCILTNDELLAEKFFMYANHGAIMKHNHIIEGINSRMDGIQAAILITKLFYINEWNNRRYEIASLYSKLLRDVKEINIPSIRIDSNHVFHVYCIKAERRDDLKKFLLLNHIETQIHYPVMLPFMPAYSYLMHNENDFPVAAKVQKSIISLPMFPELSDDQVYYVSEKIKEFYTL